MENCSALVKDWAMTKRMYFNAQRLEQFHLLLPNILYKCHYHWSQLERERVQSRSKSVFSLICANVKFWFKNECYITLWKAQLIDWYRVNVIYHWLTNQLIGASFNRQRCNYHDVSKSEIFGEFDLGKHRALGNSLIMRYIVKVFFVVFKLRMKLFSCDLVSCLHLSSCRICYEAGFTVNPGYDFLQVI